MVELKLLGELFSGAGESFAWLDSESEFSDGLLVFSGELKFKFVNENGEFVFTVKELIAF